MNLEFTKYKFNELFNLLEIVTKSIRLCLKQKTKNVRFWQIVNWREAIIAEMSIRRRTN